MSLIVLFLTNEIKSFKQITSSRSVIKLRELKETKLFDFFTIKMVNQGRVDDMPE